MKAFILIISVVLSTISAIFSNQTIKGVVYAAYNDSIYMNSLNGEKVQFPSCFIESINHFNIVSYEQFLSYSKSRYLKSIIAFHCIDNTEEFAEYLTNHAQHLFSNVGYELEQQLILEYDPIDYFWDKKKYVIFPDSIYQLWHLRQIEADKAWDITKGSPEIKIAVLDIGYDVTHPDLNGKINLSDPLDNQVFANTNRDKDHGTKVAVLAAGITDGGGYTSSAGFNTGLILYEGTPGWNGNISIGDAVAKAQHAAFVQGASVFNYSHNGSTNHSNLDFFLNAIKEVLDHGTIIVRSAGNTTLANDANRFPFAYFVDDRIIIVSSTEHRDKHASPYGVGNHARFPEVSLCAPGWLITTAKKPSYPYGIDEIYASELNGTSFSSAIVAGVCALMKSIEPSITPAEAKYIIQATADPILDEHLFSGKLGAGRINAYRSACMTLTYKKPEIITSNVIWDSSKLFSNEIVILPQAQLIINSTLRFAKGGSITIHPGGKLIINGGTLTSACEGEMWQGITVMGDPTKPMNQQHQGYVQIINGGTIEHAATAITVQGGGKVVANNAEFVGNGTDVKFEPLAQGQSGVSGTLTKTTFFTGGMGNNPNIEEYLVMNGCGTVNITDCTFADPVHGTTGKRIIATNSPSQWSGSNLLVSVPIVLQEGATLTNTGFIGHFGNSKITVRSGSKLVVNGGVHSNTGPSPSWYGIEIFGIPTNHVHHTLQSFVHIINGGKIENALCAITVKAGGVVRTSNAHFVNNTVGVKFEPLALGQAGTSGNFTTTNFVVNNSYPSNLVDFHSHLVMENSGNITVIGCSFLNATSQSNGINRGITSFNTNLYVNALCVKDPLNLVCKLYEPSIFTGFNEAISATNSGKLPTLSVKNCIFTNNKCGVTLNAVNYSQLIDNDFQLPQYNSFGVMVTNATGYKIEDNHFQALQPCLNSMTIGLTISNSGKTENEVYNNQFSHLYIGQNFLLKNAMEPLPIKNKLNAGLQTLCNTFLGSHYRDILVGSLKVLAEHSIRTNQGSTFLPAGNRFSQNVTSHFESLSNDTINYYYHNGNSVEQPTISGFFELYPTSSQNFCISNNRKFQRNDIIDNALSQYDEWNKEYEYWLVKLQTTAQDSEEYNYYYDMASYYSALKDNFFNSIIVAVMNAEEEEGEDDVKGRKQKAESDEMMWRLDDEMINPCVSVRQKLEQLRYLFAYRGQYQDYLSITETHLAENNYTAALATIDEIFERFELYGEQVDECTSEQVDELAGLRVYVRWLQQLEERGESIYKLSEKDLEYLVSFVATYTGRGRVFAHNILCGLYDVCIEDAEVNMVYSQGDCSPITTFPWSESFEENGTDLPSCWEHYRDLNGWDMQLWSIVSNEIGPPPAAHIGNYKAFISQYCNSDSYHRQGLLSPVFDFSAVDTPVMSFWHLALGKAILQILYKNSADDVSWTPLQVFSYNVLDWQREIVKLPNKSEYYQIAFMGIHAGGGYGELHLDNISITDGVPEISVPSYFKNNFSIAPNPVHDYLTISGVNPHTITLYDNLGRVLLIQNDGSNRINMGNLYPGLYFLQVITDVGTIHVQKIVKQ